MRQAAIAAIVLVVGIADAAAQTVDQEEVQLPTDPRLWRNSAPLTLDSLEGKGVVFFFFEEECRTCASKWPALNTMSKQYQGKPVLFIAVNSGSDPRTLNRYLSAAQVTWPVIHDIDRSLESAMGVPQLSMDGNVVAVRYKNAEGEILPGNETDFAATAEAALKGAAWRVDPTEIPPSLQKAWMAIELGNYSEAAKSVTQAVESRDTETKQAGEKLLKAVDEELTEAAKLAEETLNKNEHWSGYQQLDSLVKRFEGYELPLYDRVEKQFEKLSELPAIKAEMTAQKLLEKAVSIGSRGTASAVKRAKVMLKKLVADHPSTEAASEAKEYLAKFKT